VLVAAVMLGLLAVVALASSGRRVLGGDATERRQAPAAFWDFLFTGLVLAFAAGCVLLVVGMAIGRSARPKQGGVQRQLLGFAVMVGVLVAMVITLRALRDGGVRVPEQPVQEPPAATAGRGDDDAARPTRYEPDFRWEVVAVLAAAGAVAVGTGVVRRRRRAARARVVDDLESTLADVVDDTLEDLRAEPDPRRAVVAAYARMERALSAYGLPRRRAEAPLEFLDRASRELHERHPPARRLLFELTHLFERAKFSPHTVDAEMKDDAIETLTTLRAELGSAT
jgi:hypothetical protein